MAMFVLGAGFHPRSAQVPPPPTPDTDMEAAEEHEEGWEKLPRIYSIVLDVCMYILFL